jgi:GntR family transcriptional regulator, transcriptional repressor for pyruvate dehydrogenase complex
MLIGQQKYDVFDACILISADGPVKPARRRKARVDTSRTTTQECCDGAGGRERMAKAGSTILKPIDVADVTGSILEQIEEQIITGGLVEGDKLPPEQELALQAGVGRRSVRDALKALEMKGLITIRKGSGAFVTRNDLDSYIETMVRNVQAYLKLDRAKLAHLLQFRELLSGGIIGMLAQDPDPAVISTLEESLAAQDEAYARKSAAMYTRAHLKFHQAIIDSLHNPIMAMMHSQVIKILEPYMRKSGTDSRIMKSSIKEHYEILNAIKSGDAARAHAAFSSHMSISLAHLEKLV